MYKIFTYDDYVPESEFNAVLSLLEENDIPYRQRPRFLGSLFLFGSRGPGCDLMVDNEEDRNRARQLIDTWQQEFVRESRSEYEANKHKHRTREILGWLFAIVVIAVVSALSLSIGFW